MTTIGKINVPKINQHTTLSGLLAAALADARRIQQGNQNDVQLEMCHWFAVNPDGCYVCLAGAMLCDDNTRRQILNHIGRNFGGDFGSVGPSLFDDVTDSYMRAINHCREGSIGSAVGSFYQFSDENFNRGTAIRSQMQIDEWPSFGAANGLWWTVMDELVRRLHEDGL